MLPPHKRSMNELRTLSDFEGIQQVLTNRSESRSSASLDAVGRPAVNRNVGGSHPPRRANSLGSSPDTWVP